MTAKQSNDIRNNMAIETKYKTVNADGVYSCGDIGISVDEWLSLLSQPKADQYINSLLCFLREPNRLATCATVAKNNGESVSHYLGKVNNFAKWVKSSLGRFQIIGTDGNETFWLIPMKRGIAKKHGFEWQLRDELVEALRTILMKRLMESYANCEPFNDYEELYKWELLASTSGKSELDIVRATKGQNIIDNERVDSVFKSLLKDKASHLKKCVSNLFDESKPLSNRIADYKIGMRGICPPEWNQCANDERTAAALLTCHEPAKYTFYKDEIYQLICKYFGFDAQKPGRKYVHFLEIINQFAKEFGKDIQDLMQEQIKGFDIKPDNLAIQTLFWCMRDKLRQDSTVNRQTTFWMAGFTLDDADKRENFYANGNWMGLGTDTINKEIQSICVGDIIMLKSTYTKGADHKTSALKISAVGRVVSKATKGTKFYEVGVEWISTKEKEFTQFDGAYRQTIHRVTDDLFINYAKEQLNMSTPSKYQQYIDLLKESKNLVLTGAPGTGKTFMAQAITEDMGAEMKFVQFHPSYDYTDFVEGLRPVDNGNGQMGFERKDGVFKEFCKAAIKNIADSKKSSENLTKELSWQNKLEQFIEDAMENEKKFKTVNGSEFSITDMKGHTIVVHNEQNEKTTDVTVNADEVLDLLTQEVELKIVRDIRNHYGRKFGTQPDSYAFVIVKEIRAMKTKVTVVNADKVEKKPFILVIDEINRGEASKIFGELFYAIDPGYRGKTNVLVQTQYQNLVPESDVFAKGFYVPENVYILATMNDIDRSVESMDFAMRRRFTWQEVNPADTQDMLDSLSCAEKAKEAMNRLNQVIADTDGLGSAYMIGPSYFLKLKDNGGNFDKLWTMNLEPLLKEYLRGFRKAADTLERFKSAYYRKEEVTIDTADLLDEEN